MTNSSSHLTRTVAAATLAWALAAAPAAGALQAPATTPPDSAQALVEARVRDGISGLVAVTADASGHRFHAAGVTAAGGTGVDSLSVFEIGSIAKALTGLLLAEMVVRGEVALEDDVSAYLPADVRMPRGETRPITLLDLATHRSGLPRLPGNLMPADVANPYATYDADRLYDFLGSHTLRREPGEAYEYSNLGAGLLGHVLARRAGMDYEQLVIERILAPLGMKDTRLAPDAGMQSRLATGHNAAGEPTSNWQFDALAGGGGWLSTAADLRRLATAALHPPAGSLGDALELATRQHAPTDHPAVGIGLGWHVLRRGDRTVVWHNGQTGGYFAFIGFERAAGTAVMVLSATSRTLDELALSLLMPTP